MQTRYFLVKVSQMTDESKETKRSYTFRQSLVCAEIIHYLIVFAFDYCPLQELTLFPCKLHIHCMSMGFESSIQGYLKIWNCSSKLSLIDS